MSSMSFYKPDPNPGNDFTWLAALLVRLLSSELTWLYHDF